MGHPKRPGIIEAKIIEEYVVCGICLTKNRVVSHSKAVRPKCGRCGYPLPDPFPTPTGMQSFLNWIARYRRRLLAVAGLPVVGLIVWLVAGRGDRSPELPGSQPQSTDAAPIIGRGMPAYTVTVVVRRGASTEADDVPSMSLPSPTESPSGGLYPVANPNPEIWTTSESVVIVVSVCAGRVREPSEHDGRHDQELSGASVFSALRQVKGDTVNPLVSPHVVEQINISAALDFFS